MKYAKRILAAVLAAVMLVASAAPETITAAKNVTNHGTDRTQLITKDMVNNSPPSDYKIPDGLVQDAKDGLYNKYFLKEDIQTVRIEMDEDNLNYMLQNAKEKPSVMTNKITIGDTTVGYAGIKTKGNYTLEHAYDDSSSDRFSFTVNFGKYIKKKDYGAKQNFYGCNKICFNNLFFDKTALKEYNALRLMTEMGVPTSQYGVAKLYINNKYYGVYFMLEAMDSTILEQHLNTSSKNISAYLTKPEDTSLQYNSALDAYKAADGTFTMESLSSILSMDANGNYVANSDVWDTGLWENDDDTLQDVALMLPTVLTWEEKLNLLSRGKDFSGRSIDVDSQEYLELLDQIVDTDESLRYFAAHSFIVQLDNMFTGEQNYGLYVSGDGRSMMMPWDYDLGWGCYFPPNTAEDVANLRLDQMYTTGTAGATAGIYRNFPLFYVLYQNTSLREKYHAYMEDCAKIASIGGKTSDGTRYEAGRFAGTIDILEDKIRTAMSEGLASNCYYMMGGQRIAQPGSAVTGIPNLKKIIAMRSVGVWRQTNNISSKVTGYGCNLDAIGNGQAGWPSTGGTLTVVNADTGIFATATYARQWAGGTGPSLTVTQMQASSGVYQGIKKKLERDVTVYHITDTKTPTSSYRLYIPVSAEYGDARIFSYSAETDELAEFVPTVNDNLYSVVVSDISYIVVSDKGGKINLANADISVSDCVYNGKAKKPAVEVTCFGMAVSSSQYQLKYENNINAGTAKVTVTAAAGGDFTGSVTKKFKIKKATNKITVANKTIVRSVSKKTQKISLGASAKYRKLVYEYTCTNNKVKVDSKGRVTLPKNYSGKVVVTIKTAKDANYTTATQKVTITVPEKAKLSKVENASGSKAKVSWKKVSGMTGYQIQYAANPKFSKAKTVRVKGASKTSGTIKGMDKGKTYYIRIRSYKTASGKNYVSAWSTAKKITIRK